MAYLIGLTGTHSTGKSTFIEKIREQAAGKGITVTTIADMATNCRNTGFGILKDHTFESTLWIMCSVIKAELEAALKFDLVLVDRPVSDALGYLEAALEATGRSIDQTQRAYLYKLVEMHLPRYSLLFKTELDLSIPLGEGRDTDLDFRVKADKWIAHTLKTLNATTRSLDASASESIESLIATILRSKGEERKH